MKLSPKWILLGARLIPLIISAVDSIEEISDKETSGADKEEAAIDLFKNTVRGLEIGLNKEILDENEYDSMIRELIRIYIAFQNQTDD